jgi:serine/threonine-protein kinase
MTDIWNPTAVHTPEPDQHAQTVVRPAPGATDETLVRSSATAEPVVTSGTAGFAEETRRLLRKRLLVTHSAIGFVTGAITLLGFVGICPLPSEAGLGRWTLGLPLLVFGQSVAGLLFLIRYPGATLYALRVVEVTEFGTIALAAGAGRYLALTSPPADSFDPRFHDVLYRLVATLTGYPALFAVILYGVLIPNTRRRSLIGTGILCSVPILATGLAAVLNVHVREEMAEVIPTTVLPLFLAGVIAVFSATREITLQRQAYAALRAPNQLGSFVL